jgi:hypothetical protein
MRGDKSLAQMSTRLRDCHGHRGAGDLRQLGEGTVLEFYQYEAPEET